MTVSNMISEEFRMRPLRPGGATNYRMGPCFYGTAAAILLAQLTALTSAHAYIRRLRSPDLLKGPAHCRSKPNELFVGTHKVQLTGESPSPSRAMNPGRHACTLPSRGRYAKQVTFFLDETRPLYTTENNGGVRSLCDLHEAVDRIDASQV